MAKQTVTVGTANAGDGDPLRNAFVKVNANTDELYTLLGDGSTLSLTDLIDHDQLADRFTASESLTSDTAIAIDTSLADVFTLTAGHSATLNFTNVKIGDVKTLVVTGGGSSYTITLNNINGSAGTWNKISGTYDDTSATKNFIQIKFVSTSEAWYTISQTA